MEQSQINGGAEECHSSESGWTMYIGSPINDDGHSDDGDNDNMDDENSNQAELEDHESDDSMASDASSGPSHFGHPWGNSEGGYGYGLAEFQQAAAEEEHDEKSCLDKNENKIKENRIVEKKGKKNEMVFIDNNKGKDPVQGDGNKARKNYWVGKRK